MKKGFTLIELLVVVAVLALLASIVFSNLGGAREGARISNALSFQSQTHSLLGSDLVGWWNFNDSSDRYKDISGYGNDGSCTSCPTPVDGVPGTSGNALEFDGLGDYVDVGNNDSLKNMGSEVTVSAWVKYNAYGGGGQSYSVIAVKGSPWTFLMENPSGKIRFRVSAGDVDANAQDAEGHELNEWYYFVGTYDGSNIRIYKNGTQVGVTPRTGTLAVSDVTAKIGTYQGTNYNFNGLIDDVRIYSRALTAGDIQGLYAQTKDKHLANE